MLYSLGYTWVLAGVCLVEGEENVEEGIDVEPSSSEVAGTASRSTKTNQ